MADETLNRTLSKARKKKNDDFYTQLSDIERELKHYRKHFKNKVVYCNCDDPRVSNFFHYFSYNFEKLGLKKLITTCYKNQEKDLFSQNDSERAIYLEYEGDRNNNNIPDPEEIGIKHLKGDGDFRNQESIELLKQADIVVTNPPFSLFREYVTQLIKYDKKFIIIGSLSAVSYKEIFRFIMGNKLWLGYGFKGGNAYFAVPSDRGYANGVYNPATGLVKFRNVTWYTNLDVSKRHEDLILYEHYSPEKYPKYDNYNAIEVSRIKDIPMDYDGVMGVPITFLDKYNPEQFKIVGLTSGRDEFEETPTKRYINPKQINKDGSVTNGSKANTRATLLSSTKPEGIYYTADNADGYLSILYARILIKNKKVIK